MTNAFSPTYHRDHTVTVWDVYTQGWTRTSDPSDEILASMSAADRRRTCRHILTHRRADDVTDYDTIARESAQALDAYCAEAAR